MLVQSLQLAIGGAGVVILIFLLRMFIYSALNLTQSLIFDKYPKFCVIASSYCGSFKAVDLILVSFALDFAIISRVRLVEPGQMPQLFGATTLMHAISIDLGVSLGIVLVTMLTLHFVAAFLLAIKCRRVLRHEVKEKRGLYLSRTSNMAAKTYYKKIRETDLKKTRRKYTLGSAMILLVTLFVYFGPAIA
jgi:hypothetical protein